MEYNSLNAVMKFSLKLICLISFCVAFSELKMHAAFRMNNLTSLACSSFRFCLNLQKWSSELLLQWCTDLKWILEAPKEERCIFALYKGTLSVMCDNVFLEKEKNDCEEDLKNCECLIVSVVQCLHFNKTQWIVLFYYFFTVFAGDHGLKLLQDFINIWCSLLFKQKTKYISGTFQFWNQLTTLMFYESCFLNLCVSHCSFLFWNVKIRDAFMQHLSMKSTVF